MSQINHDICLSEYELSILGNAGLTVRSDPRYNQLHYEMQSPPWPLDSTAQEIHNRQYFLEGYSLYGNARSLKYVAKCVNREYGGVRREAHLQEKYPFVKDAYEKYIMALALVGYTDESVR